MATIPVNANTAVIDTTQDAQFVQLNNRSIAEIISTGNNVQVYQSKENVYVEAIQVNPTQQFITQSVNNVGGSDYQVQFALDGAFEGSQNFTYNPMSMTLSVPSINSTGNVTISSVSNFHLGGGNNGYFLQTDGAGNLAWAAAGGGGNGSPGGSNNQIQFNDNGLFGGSTNFTFDKATNKFTLNGVIGSNLIPNATTTYSLGNATNRWKDLYLSNNSLYLGNTKISADGSNLINTAAVFINDVRLAQVAITNNANSSIIFGGNVPAGNVQPIVQLGGNTSAVVQIGTNANANFTAVNGNVVLPNVSIVSGGTANFTGGNVVGGNFSNVTLNNVTISNANISTIQNGNSNVDIATNGNVTVGVAGNASILTVTGTGINVAGYVTTGNLTATGVVYLGPNSNVRITGGSNGQFLTTNGSGNLSWTTVSTSSISNGNSNVSIAANSNVTVSVAGNANVVSVTGTGANITGTANVSGNANVGNIGTATLVATTAANVANLNANGAVSFTGANVALGAVGNLHISGGSNGQYLATDGTGNLAWANVNQDRISNGTSNVNIPTANGNVTVGVGGSANVLTVTSNANIGTIANAFTSNNYILGNGNTTISTTRWIGASSSTTGDVLLYQIPAANVASIDYHVTATQGTNSRQVSKLLAVNLGTQTNYVEYGSMWVGPQIVDIFVTQSSNNIQLISTALTANNIQYNIVMTIYNN